MSDKAKKKKKSAEPAAVQAAPEPEGVEDEGLAALSALVRPSMPPAAKEPDDDADDGKLDLRALAASIPPPAAEPTEAAPGDEEPAEAASEPAPKAKPKKASEKPKAAKEPAVSTPVAATEVAAPARSGGSLWIGIGIGAAIAAAAAFYVVNNQPASGDDTLASAAPASDGAEHEVSAPDPEPLAAVEEPAPSVDPAADEGALAAEPTEEAPSAEPSLEPEASAQAEPAGEPAPVAEEEHAPRRSRGGSRVAVHAEPAAQPAAPAAEHHAEATPPPQPRTQEAQPEEGSRSIDNMLDQALGGRPNREGTGVAQPARAQAAVAASPTASSANLPDSPSRGDVVRTLGHLLPQIRQCAGDQVGMALATMMVRSDGSVASVVVGGSPFGGTPQGACMEGALRSAHFPPFRQTTFRVSYPFNIR